MGAVQESGVSSTREDHRLLCGGPAPRTGTAGSRAGRRVEGFHAKRNSCSSVHRHDRPILKAETGAAAQTAQLHQGWVAAARAAGDAHEPLAPAAAVVAHLVEEPGLRQVHGAARDLALHAVALGPRRGVRWLRRRSKWGARYLQRNHEGMGHGVHCCVATPLALCRACERRARAGGRSRKPLLGLL